jgi:hypothetical protein
MAEKFTSWYIPSQYQLTISRLGKSSSNRRMKTSDLRRRRVRELIDSPRFKGNAAAFAQAIGKSPTQVARWFMATSNRRNIGESLARDIEKALGLARLALDTEGEALTTREPLALYGVPPEEQTAVLELFDKLTAAQREEFLRELAAAVKTNEAIVREIGPRLQHPPDDYVGKFLPKAPKTGIRQELQGGGKK